MSALRMLVVVLLLACVPAPVAFGAEGAGERLLKVVALSRHGVRAPTQSGKTLELWSTKKWPEWPVGRGELTPRGAKLVQASWRNLRARLAGAGLLPGEGCLAQKDVFVRSDTDERDQATSAAILEGLGSGCGLAYSVTNDSIDPLFHPVKAGLYSFDPVAVATDVLTMTRGGFENLLDYVAGPVNLIDKISGSPAAGLCGHYGLAPKCSLLDIPNAVSVSSNGRNIRLAGGLGIASSMAEIFLLEYAQWPGDEAGWGMVNASTLAQVLPVHALVFDVINRAPVVAWARGSSLLLEMAEALLGRHYDPRANEAKLAVFVGHDTNIANIGGLLGLFWTAKGYPLNGIPPAAVLCLELWEVNGVKEVRPCFYAQPPAAQHAPFEAGDDFSAHAPAEALVRNRPGGSRAAYSLAQFEEQVRLATAGAPFAPDQTPPYAKTDAAR